MTQMTFTYEELLQVLTAYKTKAIKQCLLLTNNDVNQAYFFSTSLTAVDCFAGDDTRPLCVDVS